MVEQKQPETTPHPDDFKPLLEALKRLKNLIFEKKLLKAISELSLSVKHTLTTIDPEKKITSTKKDDILLDLRGNIVGIVQACVEVARDPRIFGDSTQDDLNIIYGWATKPEQISPKIDLERFNQKITYLEKLLSQININRDEQGGVEDTRGAGEITFIGHSSAALDRQEPTRRP